MNQQQFPRTTIHKERSFDDWRGVIVVVAISTSVYFTGPLVFLALLLQWWAALSVWRAPDRWASLRTFAWLSLLLYLPTWLFWPQIGLFWHAHLPGDFLIWPPTLGPFSSGRGFHSRLLRRWHSSWSDRTQVH